ncbi:unnamed protein product [Mytilus coruscus]|uniref:Uncharacterized protein n=1 Tax=Mytilus coruscus TaxID=42192 RepID=A0A6J8C5Y6_MYTCO|nr:unnamed protein product [Mytilus coruscus]
MAIERTKKNVKCQIKVVKIQTRDTATKNQASIPGITSYNNFVFENGGLRVWKAYGIGPDGCMKSFSKYKDLELHLHVNNCTLVQEKQCRIDLTKTLYVEKLKTSETRPVIKFSDTVQSSGETDLDQGWALRKQRKTSRFNDKQKKFLDEKFKQGTLTGNKADPTEVANEMRHKKQGNGERMFEINEFLSSQQINSYFSRTFRNLKSSSDQDQLAAAQFEQNLTNLNTSVMSKLSATN